MPGIETFELIWHPKSSFGWLFARQVLRQLRMWQGIAMMSPLHVSLVFGIVAQHGTVREALKPKPLPVRW